MTTAIRPKTDDLLPPHNPEAEEALVGALLIDPGSIIRVEPLMAGPGDFHDERGQAAYAAMLAVHHRGQAVDVLTVGDEMGDGHTVWLMDMTGRVPTSMHAEHYARIVARDGARRRLIDAAGRIAVMGYDQAQDPDEAASEAVGLLTEAFRKDGRGKILPEHLSAYYDRIEALSRGYGKRTGLPTGFQDVDTLLKGLNGYVIVAGRPSMGKSSWVQDVILYNAERGKRIAWFSLEESAEAATNRLVAKRSGLTVTDLRDGRIGDWALFLGAVDGLHRTGGAVLLDDTPGIHAGELRARCMRMAASGGLDLVVIDYLQLMHADDKWRNRQEYSKTNDVSQALKTLGRELAVPVLAVSQLSRALESRQEKRPTLADLRDSGALEQDADVVIFIYRDEYYHPDTTPQPGIAEIIVAKSRDGPTGMALLAFEGRCVRFRDVELRTMDEIL